MFELSLWSKRLTGWLTDNGRVCLVWWCEYPLIDCSMCFFLHMLNKVWCIDSMIHANRNSRTEYHQHHPRSLENMIRGSNKQIGLATQVGVVIILSIVRPLLATLQLRTKLRGCQPVTRQSSRADNVITCRAYFTFYDIYNTKIDEFVGPPNISQTVAVSIMKFAHRPRVTSTTNKLISKPILLSILLILLKGI